MTAAVELDLASGQAAFVAAGQPGWHGLGTTVEKAMNGQDALELSHCNGWDVHTVELFGAKRSGSGMSARTIKFPGRYGTVRTNPFTGELEGLGTVGNLWTPVQNEEIVVTLDAIVQDSGAHYHTMGSLDDGKRFFCSMKLPEGMLVGGVDPVDLYLIACNPQDGSGALRFFASGVRPVCSNTLNAAAASAVQTWTMRHSTNIEGKIQQARESLRLTWSYRDAVNEEWNALLNAKMDDKEFDRFLLEVLPNPESEKQGWIDRAEAQRNIVRDLWKNSDTVEVGRGTRWGAYNAITEYADWKRPGSPERHAREAIGVSSATQRIKPQAYALLKAGL